MLQFIGKGLLFPMLNFFFFFEAGSIIELPEPLMTELFHY